MPKRKFSRTQQMWMIILLCIGIFGIAIKAIPEVTWPVYWKVMAVALLAVQELAAQTDGGFLWTPGLAYRDPSFVLPLVFGVLITLYIDLAFATSAKSRALIWIVMLPLMTATGTLISAGADVNVHALEADDAPERVRAVAPLVDLGGCESEQAANPGNAVDEEPAGPRARAPVEDGVR